MFDDGTHQDYMAFTVNITPGPALTLDHDTVRVCAGVTATTLSFSNLTNVGPSSTPYSYTGGAQAFTVPAGVSSVQFDLLGASGGRDNRTTAPTPGLGGRIRGTLSVTPGQSLNIFVGGMGADGSVSGAIGGYNGGGNAQYDNNYGSGGAGGGATDIRVNGITLSNRVAVAGGGGGNGADYISGNAIPKAGGNGGGTTGGNSQNNAAASPSHAGGGSLSGGGAPATFLGWAPGSFGTQGVGGAGSSQGLSGGGGGGYFGGGGGIWTGGGGGGSYASTAATLSITHNQGVNTGNGAATIYYVLPGTYDIVWNADASAAGFNNVANVTMPVNGQFNITIPETVEPGTYHGVVRVNKTGTSCSSPDYDFYVTVKPIPDVVNPGNKTSCGGDVVVDVPLSGSVSGGAYNWVNDNTAIGLGAAGEGHFTFTMPENTTPDQIIANIKVTPVADGCIGDSVTFQIINNPIPKLNGTLTPGGTDGICNSTLFSYLTNSLTPGTAFSWERASITGITSTNAGNGNINEILTNTDANPVSPVYVYTLTANGCTNVQSVTVNVNPTPVLSNPAPGAICNNTEFNFTPASATTAATFAWSRTTTAGISNSANNGIGNISETLINTVNAPRAVTYHYTLGINGCTTTQDVVVTVNPTSAITSTLTASTCSGQLYNYTAVTNTVSGTSVSWSRAAVAGIMGNGTATATGLGNTISETLVNANTAPVVVNYVYSLVSNSCTYTQTLAVTVKPSPVLSSTLTPAAICTNDLFEYHATSATVGTTFLWSRDNQLGISTPASGLHTNDVSEVLSNSTDSAVAVDYNYTLTANGCVNAQIVTVTVNPAPRLSNDISALAVCDSALFHFVPASNTLGTTFAWSRAYQAGVSNLAAFGTNSPEEYLNNSTYINVIVPYTYTVTANGCSNVQNFSVSVRPSPILSTSHTAAACSSAPFVYEAVSYTPGTSFAWSRAGVTGITPATASGTGNIMDTLTQTSSAAMSVVYVYTLTTSGCTNKQLVTVSVNPGPVAPVISIHPAASICGNSTNINFGADAAPAAGLTYYWSATNATVESTGADKRYSIVSFTNPGTAVVTLTARIGSTTCISSSSYTVTVGDVLAESPEVIYFDNQFICRQNQQNGYQWGYDDATSLDSNVIVGETNQNYANAYPDWTNKRYWVMTTHNGCTQKTYYNKPTGVDDVNITAGIKVFPNPANDFINVEISSMVKGDITVSVTNLLGQKLNAVSAVNNKAQISVAQLPAGCYLVDCFSEGVKIGAARFIKN